MEDEAQKVRKLKFHSSSFLSKNVHYLILASLNEHLNSSLQISKDRATLVSQFISEKLINSLENLCFDCGKNLTEASKKEGFHVFLSNWRRDPERWLVINRKLFEVEQMRYLITL